MSASIERRFARDRAALQLHEEFRPDGGVPLKDDDDP